MSRDFDVSTGVAVSDVARKGLDLVLVAYGDAEGNPEAKHVKYLSRRKRLLEYIASLEAQASRASDDQAERGSNLASRSDVSGSEQPLESQGTGASDARPLAGMRFDSFRLGYSRHGETLRVHYPIFMGGDEVTYAAGFTFDPHPEILAKPDSERGKLWKEMLSAPREKK
jgi:hypothetical protein